MVPHLSGRLSLYASGVAMVVWIALAPLARSLEAPPTAFAEQAERFNASDLWLAPPPGPAAPTGFAAAVADLNDGHPDSAIPTLVRATGDPDLGGYAHLYLGRAYLAQDHADRALASARLILEQTPGGYLREAALALLADASAKAEQWDAAIEALQALTGLRSETPQRITRLAQVAEEHGDPELARGAYARVYYDWPLSAEASDAGDGLTRLGGVGSADTVRLGLARAQTLFAARRYADARKAFAALRGQVAAADRWAVDLRLIQCDVGLKRWTQARDALTPYLAAAPGSHAEAEFARLAVLRGLKRDTDYVAAVRRFVTAHPGDPLAEAALNDLATFHVLANDDAAAAAVFAEMYAAFPTGAFADRAAWRAGWWAYKAGDYREASRIFESAAASMRRADYRPAWLYWSGRARAAAGDRDGSVAAYRQTLADYRNSYYGREALAQAQALLGGNRPAVVLASLRTEARIAVDAGAPPARARVIQRLLAVGLCDDAIAELRKAQLEGGTSPLIEATIAYALNRRGDLRPAITAMRRAYPQFMADGGEGLPRSILSVIFPVAHWDLIQEQAAVRSLDPFLVAALVAQESTFQADIRSAANAWGAMQILPSTGRRYAPRLGLRPFSTSRLTDPDVNVRIGTAYLADLIDQFKDVASALAAYNAGENRVSRWRAERPGIAQDEFVDDIPFPETQNYVKRILGTAEDYRGLYGPTRVAAMRESDR